MDNFHGLVMDDWTLLFLSYFYILISYGLMDRLTLVLVKLLLRLKIQKALLVFPNAHQDSQVMQ